MPSWYLEVFLDGTQLTRVPLQRLPFQIGRGSQAGLTLDNSSISRLHAEFFDDSGTL